MCSSCFSASLFSTPDSHFSYDYFSAQSLPGAVAKEVNWGAFDQVKSLLIRIRSARRTSRIPEFNSQQCCRLPHKVNSGLIFENIVSNVLHTVNSKWVWRCLKPKRTHNALQSYGGEFVRPAYQDNICVLKKCSFSLSQCYCHCPTVWQDLRW